ncbi:nucleotidyl transferase AbiEii/AbiGii toxin family protein [Micromonospora sp. WMMD1128]|uniref:nucleotidyl transferase AbiEii/AbiGii toxin family protein n=1 Tax=unclassified Micromonospora TaxID=2617518 RepID=UPI00248AB4FC|nr:MULTISPECIES: nucleotidyl transferase AbiEii/AbiGii toxin family protein [unclassified Micromonospora]WBB76462.1 nucleotidyl transferase AbiEii/AbiGii toxin family protein [Micromonospora sp. WMMD1128]WFE35754.1 nucleotidyl transferase AbiEii/AbiGii toxin family protein [Micromonospora sp. WMMD975]
MTHPHDFYREVARVALAAAGPHRFVLGGGVAWAAHGLVTRPTEDVDLFADVEGAAAAAAADVRAALERAGYRVDEADPDGLGEVFDGFDRDLRDFVVSRGDRRIRLSLARLDRHRSPVVMDFGPVMDVRDLIANKTAALVNRREVRDYIDVAAALDRYAVTELLALARQVDPALEDADVRAAGRYLDGLADRRFTRYGLDPARIAEVRRRMAAWPR